MTEERKNHDKLEAFAETLAAQLIFLPLKTNN
jgi:hypothetical protein